MRKLEKNKNYYSIFNYFKIFIKNINNKKTGEWEMKSYSPSASFIVRFGN